MREFFQRKVEEVLDEDRKRCAETGEQFHQPNILGFRSKDLVVCLLRITDKEEATKFFSGYVEALSTLNPGPFSAREHAAMALAPYLGFGMPLEQVAMWQLVMRDPALNFQKGEPLPIAEEALLTEALLAGNPK